MTRKALLFIVLIGFCFSLGLRPATAQVIGEPDIPALLTHIVPAKTPEGVDIKLVCTFYSKYKAAEFHSPNRIVIDLNGVEDIAAPRLIEFNQSGLLRIRAGMYLEGVARVVLDLAEEMPSYKIVPVKDGLLLLIRPRPGPAQTVQSGTETKADLKADGRANLKTDAKEKGEVSAQKRQAGQKLSEGTAQILGRTIESRPQPKKNFLRFVAAGDYFFPRQGALKRLYGRGMNYGGEVNIGITRLIELWLGGHYFGKTMSDSATGGRRKVSLIPLEAGIKLRFHRGVFNPYLGLGGGYFQYEERTDGGTVKDNRIGLVGQAGFFIKIARLFVIDLSAQYKYCPMESAAGTFDVGGFHIGAGLGLEF